MSRGKEKPHKPNMKCDCVDRLVAYMFRSLGYHVGRRPGYFIIIPVLLAGLLATGMQRINYVDDPEYLFSPLDGPGKEERRVIETLFPMNLSTNFDVGRMTRLSPFARMMIEAKDGKSIFDKEVFDELILIDQKVRNISIWWDHRLWSYKNMCARKNKRCFVNDILDYADRVDAMEKGQFSIEYPLMINEVTFKVFFSAAFLGGITTDELNMIEKARAVNLLYFIESNERTKERANLWEQEFLRLMEEEEFQHINIAYYTSLTLAAELEKVTISVLPLFSLTVVIMLAFSVSTCMMLDWVRSKPWLGVIGCTSSAIAVAAAFGLTVYCGLEFIGLNLAAPFLMLGIGMDDTFVLLAAWRRTNRNLSVPERMASAYADAGVSITITSLTNFISFWIGVITPFPSVRIFCVYTAMSVLFTYIYHVTFFGACMALHGYAEQRNLHSLIFVPTMPKSMAQNRGTFFRLLCTGGINPLDPDNPLDNEENLLMKFFRDKLGTFLSKKSVKSVILVLFLLYLCFGLWGCTIVKEGLERFKMARYDSYSIDYYHMEDKYFRKYPYRIQVVINQTLDYSDPKVVEQIEELLQALENNELMAGPRYTESWLRIYHRFIKDHRTQIFLSGMNLTTKSDFYRGIKQVFFRLSQNYFEQDIKFNEDFSEITASRFVLQTENIMDAEDEKRMLIELRAIAAKSPFPTVVYNQLFVFFDQFLLVRETSIQAVGVATAVMLLISFIFIPIPACALWVAFSIFSIEIGVVGYMSWWNVNLDAISMINLILCIGFSVDYSAHITYAYISSEEKDPNERMKTALHSLGLPIFQGSVSTLIGIVVLDFAPSYIFTVFFKTVFLVILFGAIHGLLLLPILLSMTDTCCSGKEEKEKKVEKEHPPPYYITTTGGKDGDLLKDGKVLSNNYITEEPVKYKSTATWTTDNVEVDQGIGTSGESSDGSWRGGNDAINHAHQLRQNGNQGSKNKITSVGHPRDSPRIKDREDHINPGFIDDDGMRASDRTRMHNYHVRHQDNTNGQNLGPNRKSSPKWSPKTKKNAQNDPKSPLNRYMARLNSGYVREFQMPL